MFSGLVMGSALMLKTSESEGSRLGDEEDSAAASIREQ
jgi:hypothetical protein